MGERPSLQHSIDRYPNNDGNYEPSNCRWATKSEQRFNQEPSAAQLAQLARARAALAARRRLIHNVEPVPYMQLPIRGEVMS
jgi:hypothetical protein